MPPQPPRRGQDNPFADFMSAFNPNRAPGRGIDHQPSDPFFPDGFPFVGSWGAPHPPGPPHPPHPPGPPPPPGAAHSHMPHPRPPPGGWQGFNWWTGDDDDDDDDGDDAEFHHDHHNHHHHHGRHGRRGGRHGRRGRHPDDDNDGGTRDHPMTVGSDNEATNTDREKQPENGKADSPNTVKDDVPDPDEVLPDDGQLPPPYGRGHCGRGGRGGCRRGGRGRGRNSNSNDMPFNFPGLMRGVASHPFFQHMSNAAYQYRNGMHPTAAAAAAAAAAAGAPSSSLDSDSFAPPIDTFNTEAAYILHVALPGAKKDDIGVNWNPDVGELTISGVVHRPGDEEFLKTMHAAERRVGMFERKVTLPPVGLAEQRRDDVVDGMGITAKLEDGLLVVVVPKVEKGWTEIRKVDIE